MTNRAPSALHRGVDELPYVDLGDGTLLQLIHADLDHELWVGRMRLEPGTVLLRHRHTGPVQVCTISGRWKYQEYADINTAGSYLYEPAGSVHTFTVFDDNDSLTDIWFSVHGANDNLDDNDEIVSVFDASTVSRYYFEKCEESGLPRPNIIET